MTEQSGYVLGEAVRLLHTVQRQVRGGTGRGQGWDTGPEGEDVWGQATREGSPYDDPGSGRQGHQGHHIATGSVECRYCPVCRTIAAARTSGPEVVSHVMDAGQAIVAAAREAFAAYERTRPPRRGSAHDPIDIG